MAMNPTPAPIPAQPSDWNDPRSTPAAGLDPGLRVSLQVLLGLGTGSLLLGLTLGQGVLQTLVELGELSEELLRGDRLPILKAPASTVPDAASANPRP
ncbi:hypothetical protein [Prochlorothrix hollandica]|uniref:hypothetical protein n=1 Tax=Prochlorothrix hollandica TaxID=1223 RepID=UPI001930B247|nr:hypothetical protein [Prochlorothrix hollandica]